MQRRVYVCWKEFLVVVLLVVLLLLTLKMMMVVVGLRLCKNSQNISKRSISHVSTGRMNCCSYCCCSFFYTLSFVFLSCFFFSFCLFYVQLLKDIVGILICSLCFNVYHVDFLATVFALMLLLLLLLAVLINNKTVVEISAIYRSVGINLLYKNCVFKCDLGFSSFFFFVLSFKFFKEEEKYCRQFILKI